MVEGIALKMKIMELFGLILLLGNVVVFWNKMSNRTLDIGVALNIIFFSIYLFVIELE